MASDRVFAIGVLNRRIFPAEAAEIALAHAVGYKVEATYRRGDMFEIRRRLMQAWANFAANPEVANIVKLRFAAAQYDSA